jgi:hypothetical protein
MLLELGFVLAAAVVGLVVYSIVLPRLLTIDPKNYHLPGETHLTLQGPGFRNWVILIGVINLCSIWGYFALSAPHGDARLYFMLLGVGLLFALFWKPKGAALSRIPEVRFGSTIGMVAGFIIFFVLRGLLSVVPR